MHWTQLKSTANQLSIFIQNQHVIIRAFKQTQHNPCAASFRTPLTLWGLVGMVIYTNWAFAYSNVSKTYNYVQLPSNIHSLRYPALISTHISFSQQSIHLACIWFDFLINKAWSHASLHQSGHENTSKMWFITNYVKTYMRNGMLGGLGWLHHCKNICHP